MILLIDEVGVILPGRGKADKTPPLAAAPDLRVLPHWG